MSSLSAFPVVTNGEVPLRDVWSALRRGVVTVASWSTNDDAHFLVLERQTAPQRPVSNRDLDIVEATLTRGVRSVVAVELGVSPSTIAVIVQGCLQRMGLHTLPSRVPLVLVFAACAGGHNSNLRVSLEEQGNQLRIRLSRPENALAKTLAIAEFEVLKLLIEGSSYAEIATIRGTSIRTIANQVASAFRRLGVSGRGELLSYLFRRVQESESTNDSAVCSPSDFRGTVMEQNDDPLLQISKSLLAIEDALARLRAERDIAREIRARVVSLEKTVNSLKQTGLVS
jgi:DNA-binding CsgD family transcriptional regulator